MDNENIKKHMGLLGLKVQDTVTGFTGIVASVSFDLYGCIQAIINPGLDKDGKIADSHWFDVSRLKVLSKKPCMKVPNFYYGPVSDGVQGAAEKPSRFKI